jgi:hypothetical protein
MKNIFITLMIAGVSTGIVLAQAQEIGDKQKMEVFSDWVGQWEGESTIQMGPGAAHKANVDEHIEFKLDGMVLMMQGVGTTADATTKKESIVHQALGILSYDQQSGRYKFRTWLADGKMTEAWFKDLSDDKYQWGFDTPQGKVRYNIALDPAKKNWRETGEFSSDGTKWHKFLEMNLAKME